MNFRCDARSVRLLAVFFFFLVISLTGPVAAAFTANITGRFVDPVPANSEIVGVGTDIVEYGRDFDFLTDPNGLIRDANGNPRRIGVIRTSLDLANNPSPTLFVSLPPSLDPSAAFQDILNGTDDDHALRAAFGQIFHLPGPPLCSLPGCPPTGRISSIDIVFTVDFIEPFDAEPFTFRATVSTGVDGLGFELTFPPTRIPVPNPDDPSESFTFVLERVLDRNAVLMGFVARIDLTDVVDIDVALVDPFEGLLEEIQSVNPSEQALAVGGREVSGVAADGVARLLLRLTGPRELAGQEFDLSLQDEEGKSVADIRIYGGLGLLGDLEPSDPTVTVKFEPNPLDPDGAVAYALFRAPMDFVRPGNETDKLAAKRSVTLAAAFATDTDSATRITILRPPILFVHGLASDPGTAWRFFMPLIQDDRFQRFGLDYSSVSSQRGVGHIARDARATLERILHTVRDGPGLWPAIAVNQFDIVAHSLGGLIARAFVIQPNYLQQSNFFQGFIHKLITLSTPHLGSEWASVLRRETGPCRSVFSLGGISGAGGQVRDLVPQSAFLRRLNRIPLVPRGRPTHTIVADASALQEATSIAQGQTVFNTTFFRGACPTISRLFRRGNTFGRLLAESDLVVSASSQMAIELFRDVIATKRFDGKIHTSTAVFPLALGPDIKRSDVRQDDETGDFTLVQDTDPSVVDHVVSLLNRSTLSDSFGEMVP